MDIFDRPDLDNLLKTQAGPCVSIFLPTERTGREVQQNPIRLKNLLREAEQRLSDLGVRGADKITKPAHDLEADSSFWRHQGDGLALFLAPDFAESYTLPVSFADLVVVADHFHLKPLLPMMSAGEHFYVLGLSQKYVKLFRGGRYSVGEVHLTGVPASLRDALQYDDREPSLQSHSGGERAPSSTDRASERTTRRTTSSGTSGSSTPGSTRFSRMSGLRWFSPASTIYCRCTGR